MGIYEDLGIRTVINAAGTITVLGGSVMEQETIKAMDEAAQSFVYMDELMKKAGELIAQFTGADVGLVTSGAAASLALAAAACITGKDSDKVLQLPDTDGMKNEVIIQRLHRNGYDRCLRISGAKLVEVGDNYKTKSEDIESAINEQTAAIAYFVFDQPGVLPLEEVIKIGRKHKVPVIVDAAAEVPPPENLRKFIAMGADLVLFSGGKQLLGPNDTGILCGRKDLIEAACLNAFPSSQGIGRTMKVSKEQIVGLVVALKRYVEKDHAAEMNQWRVMAESIAERLNAIPNLRAEVVLPKSGPRPLCIPKVEVHLDEEKMGITASELVKNLKEGNPAVEVLLYNDQKAIQINPQCLSDGQEEVVIERIEETLLKHVPYQQKMR